MNQLEALQRLRALATPVVETRDVAALLQASISSATTILRRLAQKRMVTHLSRGRWLVHDKIDRLALPELISAPYPAYVSLQSALFHHGLIEQVPSVIYAVTPARPRRLQTPMGTISFHRIPPELFMGFELLPRSDAKVATPEKALFDLLYLAPGRSRLFSQQPELTIPRRFQWERLKEYTKLVKSAGRRTYIAERIKILRSARS
ncbi:MAG: type IV toxin-antitoxin system AbiEi family antitoxin domain-containing protein [Steroidobacteraceae bacterium]